ncbi:MAG: hypothetical protein ACRECR_06760 [Thermoplasmata archaeon]
MWEEFAHQDPGEVARRIEALPEEGRRPRVILRKGKEEEQLRGLLNLLKEPGSLEPHRAEWAVSIGCSPPVEASAQ